MLGHYADGTIYWSSVDQEVDFTAAEVKTDAPEVPPECHNDRPIDADRCMAAVRAMCS